MSLGGDAPPGSHIRTNSPETAVAGVTMRKRRGNAKGAYQVSLLLSTAVERIFLARSIALIS